MSDFSPFQSVLPLQDCFSSACALLLPTKVKVKTARQNQQLRIRRDISMSECFQEPFQRDVFRFFEMNLLPLSQTNSVASWLSAFSESETTKIKTTGAQMYICAKFSSSYLQITNWAFRCVIRARIGYPIH